VPTGVLPELIKKPFLSISMNDETGELPLIPPIGKPYLA
jgi:hypothetical protein